MLDWPRSPFLNVLKDRINLEQIPFSDRSSRLLVFKRGSEIYIRLSERWFKQEQKVGHYRRRAPLISEWRFTDGVGNPLEFKLTSYPHQLCFDTERGPFEMAFLDAEALYLSLPPTEVGFSFKVYAERGWADRRGGVFKGPRNIAYSTNARIISNEVIDLGDGYFRVKLVVRGRPEVGLVLNITPRLGFNRALPAPEEVFAAAARRWHEWFELAPPVKECYRPQYYYAWWIMRSGLISTRFYTTREAMTPSKIHYVGVWQWDAYFHALAYRHIDPKLAKDQLRIVLDHQREDGMIPDAVHDEGIVTHLITPVDADVTKPPLLGWTALKLYQISPDLDFLNEIYEPLVRWNRWWFENNDDDGDGIVQYNHPFSSGLDDSPLWDEGMPVESPDLNTYLCVQMDSLSEIARLIGEEDEAVMWRKQADELSRKIVAHFYDPRAGLFWAMKDHQPVKVLTPFNLYPLWTGRLKPEITERLIAHLMNPAEFWTPYPIPTVARNDSKYDPNQMWRGPIWANINYIFIEALLRNGHPELARKLRDRTLKLIMGQNDIYEYYNPETGEPPLKAASIFGWSSAVFIDLAIQASRD